MKKNSKTLSDVWFERYCLQEGIKCKYEPYTNRYQENPDYYFIKDNKKTLVEIKEIDHIFLDNAKETVQTHDYYKHLRLFKDRIKAAAKQIKPYKDEVDYCLIIFGKTTGFNICTRDLFFAMFGDPKIKAPIDFKTGRIIKPPFIDLAMTGQLRNNGEGSKHKYISGVGIMKRINVLEYYKKKLVSKYLEKIDTTGMSLPDQLEFSFSEGKRILRDNKSTVSKIYKTKRVIYKLEVLANPYSNKPLSDKIFQGLFDEVTFPNITQA